MWTYHAERIVGASPTDVESGLAAVVAGVWGRRARLVVRSTTAGRVDAIHGESEEDGPEVWLTWHIEPAGEGTRVRLLLDEVEHGPDPRDGLEQVLDTLERQLAARRTA